ncbi:MAG: response regulator [Nitrospirae bacterium]|nr:response regulator [Nitrospirota bacterium]
MLLGFLYSLLTAAGRVIEMEFTEELSRQYSLLYVEDEDNVREGLLRFLQRRFKIVYTGRDGQEGLEQFKSHRPDIIITDIQMPLMDGLEMVNAIKEISPSTPVIITTAFNEIPYLMKAIELHIDSYIKKPIIKEEIISAIRKSVQFLIQKHEIEIKNKIIQAFIDINPRFAFLVTKENVLIMNRFFLNFFGYDSFEEFAKDNANGFTNAQGIHTPVYNQQDLVNWINALNDSAEQQRVVYIKNKGAEKEHPFVVICKEFAPFNIFLFTFIEGK